MAGVRSKMSLAARVVCACSCLLTVVSAQQEQTTIADQQGLESSVAAAPEVDLATAAAAAIATYGHGGAQNNDKFFMYAHQPGKKQYEFGFKSGNKYHNIERYEKAGPNHNFKTKVRWTDAKGGHGEHYWDYNHGPKYHDDHGNDHGGYGYDHQQDGGRGHDGHSPDSSYGRDDPGHGGYGHGGDYGQDEHGGYHSQPVPDYAPATRAASDSTVTSATDALPPLGKQERPSHHSEPHRSTDANRDERNSSKNVSDEVGVDKDAGSGKKNYHYYNKKQTFEYRTTSSGDDVDLGEESSSAFPKLLGFNPYLQLGTDKKGYVPQSASVRRPYRSAALRRHSGGKKDVPSALENCGASTTSTEASAASWLSLDPETCRVYSEHTGLWYSLVPAALP